MGEVAADKMHVTEVENLHFTACHVSIQQTIPPVLSTNVITPNSVNTNQELLIKQVVYNTDFMSTKSIFNNQTMVVLLP